MQGLPLVKASKADKTRRRDIGLEFLESAETRRSLSECYMNPRRSCCLAGINHAGVLIIDEISRLNNNNVIIKKDKSIK